MDNVEMIEQINGLFWWVGMMVSLAGVAVMACGLFVFIGYVAFSIVANYRAAGFVVCKPHKPFDFWLYRKLYRFKQTVSFIFGGVPSEMIANDGTVLFRREWLKGDGNG